MNAGKIIIETHDGRSFTYENQTVEFIIGDLRAAGVPQGGIKNTIHIIPKLRTLVVGEYPDARH